MNQRKQRGMLLAATADITKKGRFWIVPSQTSRKRRYRVCLSPKPHCQCADHQTTGRLCKHLWAVKIKSKRKKLKEIPTIKQAFKKPTYPQNWRAYDRAQRSEVTLFTRLLHELCQRIPEPPRKPCRPRTRLADIVFCACYKVYSRFSGRRVNGHLERAKADGLISVVPHFNAIFRSLSRKDLTPVLLDVISTTSAVLSAVEVDFAVDSSGFTSSRFVTWIHHKYGNVHRQHEWVKVHLMCGVKTNVVTAVEIHDKDANDMKLLPPMVRLTAKHFNISEVSADAAYGSVENYDAIERVGGTPYIAFKTVHTGYSGGLWKEMFTMFQRRRAEFLRHYHKRSNVESTFAMIKTKFGDHVRSKTDVGMKNEVLCKIICHNICRLIHAMQEHGIEATFPVSPTPPTKA